MAGTGEHWDMDPAGLRQVDGKKCYRYGKKQIDTNSLIIRYDSELRGGPSFMPCGHAIHGL